MPPDQLANEADSFQPEANTHSFVIRFWLEEIATDTHEPLWRGHITHVPSGKRIYLQDLDAIVTFIASYLRVVD